MSEEWEAATDELARIGQSFARAAKVMVDDDPDGALFMAAESGAIAVMVDLVRGSDGELFPAAISLAQEIMAQGMERFPSVALLVAGRLGE